MPCRLRLPYLPYSHNFSITLVPALFGDGLFVWAGVQYALPFCPCCAIDGRWSRKGALHVGLNPHAVSVFNRWDGAGGFSP